MSKPKAQMTTETMLITPEWAQEQLDEMERRISMGKFRQRPVRDGAVRRYAQDMRKGKWLVTHQGIAFDSAGNLIDGQNRLRAVVLSNCKVAMRVTFNVAISDGSAGDVSPMDTIDLGVPRSMWQALQISHGYAGEAVEMSSIARGISRFVIGNPNRAGMKVPQGSLSTAQGLVILERLNYRESAERLAAIIPAKKQRPAAIATTWCWYHKVHPRKAEGFATDYEQLQNLGAAHPALVLFKFMSVQKLRARKRDLELMSIVANCLQAYHLGETIRHIRASDEAHLWLLKLNWKDVETITDLVIGEKAADELPNANEEPPAKAA